MDFRGVNPAGVEWSIWSRGQPVPRLPGGARVQVQTPLCGVRVSSAGSGMYRIDMSLRPDIPLHSDFCQWVCDIEDGASGAVELAEWRGARSRSTSVYNNSMRLMAFSDTLAFDAAGSLSAHLMDAAGAACIIELSGLWNNESRWGLRWKIVQIKFQTDSPVFPASAFVDEDAGDAKASINGFAFVED